MKTSWETLLLKSFDEQDSKHGLWSERTINQDDQQQRCAMKQLNNKGEQNKQ